MRLGNLIEKITTVTGIKKLFGNNCTGCRKRKKKLNKINATGIACWIVLILCCVMALWNSSTGNMQAICDWAVIAFVVVILMFYSLIRKK